MNALIRSFEELGLPPFLQELTSVVIALLDEQGRILAANRGFWRLAAVPESREAVLDARTLFLNPRLEDVRALVPYHGNALLLYRGILNLAHGDQPGRSLQGHIYHWSEGRLLVAAEYDVAGLELLGATVLRLNEELAETQRQLLRANRELKRNEATIRELMHLDVLTGAGNRQCLDEALAAEVERARHSHRPLGLIVVDLDHFKEVNDRYGYKVGDEALKQFVVRLRGHCRPGDVLARFSGEEFVLLLPGTNLLEAVACAERIRRDLESKPLTPQTGRVTASFGVAMWAAGEGEEQVLRRAHQALHRSKREGRNRVTQSIVANQHAALNTGCC